MSANLLKATKSGLFGQKFKIDLICKRFTAAKSPGQSQRGLRRPPKNLKLNYIPGEKVEERTILGKQKTLKYHPGFNVGLDPKDKSLYALTSGTVFYSIEKFNPNPKSLFVQKFYSQQEIRPVYKKYIHVIRDKNPIEFKLIDII